MMVEINKGRALLKKDFNIKELLNLINEKPHVDGTMHDHACSLHHLKSTVG